MMAGGLGIAARTLTIFVCTVSVPFLTRFLLAAKLRCCLRWSSDCSLHPLVEQLFAYAGRQRCLQKPGFLTAGHCDLSRCRIVHPFGEIMDILSLQIAFIIPLIAYVYVAFYGLVSHAFGSKKADDGAKAGIS
jgi:hypothetical protein